MTRDCNRKGHVWLTEDEKPYARQRGADLNATVLVHCKHCPLTRDLPKYSTYSGPRAPGQPVNHAIPPALKQVIDRALESASTDGPVPKPQ